MPYPGQPEDTPIPPELDRWNWGAFFLNWIWGLGNSTYIALLMFVPVVNLVMPFVLGAKGNQWAWKNRLWKDADHFRRTQRNWARAGLALVLLAVLFLAVIFTALPRIIKSSGAYKQSIEMLHDDPVAMALLGAPVSEGRWINGQLSVQNDSGTANLSIPVSGPKCSGYLLSRAEKSGGVWDVYLLVLKTPCSSEPVVLRNSRNLRISGAVTSEEI